MTEAVLPSVLIEVRPEGLIVPGAVSVGNLGVVGTASKGPIGTPVLLGSYTAARSSLGEYDRWVDGRSGELTLVRALEQAYQHGATTVYAVRVGDANAAAASLDLASPGGTCVTVRATSPGTWGNAVSVRVSTADTNAVVAGEEVAGPTHTLAHTPVIQSATNRIVIRPGAGGADRVPGIVYDTAPSPTGVGIDTASGVLTFGAAVGASDTVLASYTVARSAAVKVSVKVGLTEETYSVVSGDDLVADLEAQSSLVTGVAGTSSSEVPDALDWTALTGGDNGAAGADPAVGLEALLDVDAHIIVAAGMDQDFGDDLARHCATASGNENKRDRIAVTGSALEPDRADQLAAVSAHTLNSDRVILVSPGIRAADRSQSPPVAVTLPGSYAAAAVAGLLSSKSPHTSLTNQPLPVDGLEHAYSSAELKQLVLSRVLVLEQRQGFKVVKGITTSTNTAWHQITTRRIVDYTKAGVRSAATPYIGLLNNERVRGALRATINSFLNTMVQDEMLVSYELDVHASRDDEIRGIALVDLVVRPTFSIDFIKITMFLE